MLSVWDIKSGKSEAYIEIQVALYWELVRNGTDEGLCFDKEHHRFTVNGKALPSVTQILRHEGIIPDMKYVTDRGLLRGTYVHSATEYFDNGTLDESTVDEEIKPYLDCYKQFKADYSGKITHAEKRLWHPVYNYAGIVDRITDDKECHILFLQPKIKRQYTFEEIKNIRGALNVGLSALNVYTWKKSNLKEG